MHLSNWIWASVMTISDSSKVSTSSPPTAYMEILQVQYTQHDFTMKSTPVVSLCIRHSDTAVAADKHYLVCDHVHSVTHPASPPLFQNKSKWSWLCRRSRVCHSVSSVRCQRCICCSHISEDTRKRLSVDFICLFGSLPDCWSV